MNTPCAMLLGSLLTLTALAALAWVVPSPPLRLDAFPAQLVCTDAQGRSADWAQAKQCVRAHVVPADR